MSAVKEVHYFDLNYRRGRHWYYSHLATTRRSRSREEGTHVLSGETTPYYIFHPLVAGRIAQDLPRIKLITLLRDPVERAYSHYQHERRKGREKHTFEAAIHMERDRLRGEKEKLIADPSYRSVPHQRFSYLARGRYVEQLPVWRGLFPPTKLLVLRAEDLYSDPADVWRAVLDFLDLPAAPLRHSGAFNVGEYSPISPRTRALLARYFRPFNHRLYALLGRDYGWG